MDSGVTSRVLAMGKPMKNQFEWGEPPKSGWEGLVFINLVKSKGGGDQVFQKMVGRSDLRGHCSFDIYSNTCI